MLVVVIVCMGMVMSMVVGMVVIMGMMVIMPATGPVAVIMGMVMLLGMGMFMRMRVIVAVRVRMGLFLPMAVAVIMQMGMGMIVMIMGMIMPAPAIGTVVMSSMRTMVMCTMVVCTVIVACMGIGPSFGLEGPRHVMGVAPLPAHHFSQNMIILNIDRLGNDFGRRMAIADMPRHFQQAKRIVGFDFQQ